MTAVTTTPASGRAARLAATLAPVGGVLAVLAIAAVTTPWPSLSDSRKAITIASRM